MKKILLSAFLLLMFVSLANGEVPQKLSFQGRLTDAAGTPMGSKNCDVTLYLYDAEEGGNRLYDETINVTTNEDGIFSAVLGKDKSLKVDFKIPVWLEINQGGRRIGKRISFSALPYAITAKNLVGGAVSAKSESGAAVYGSGVIGVKGEGTSCGGYFESGSGVGVYGSSVAAGNLDKAFKVDWFEMSLEANETSKEESFNETRHLLALSVIKDLGAGWWSVISDSSIVASFDETNRKVLVSRGTAGSKISLRLMMIYY